MNYKNILIINKPKNMTSNDVVQFIKKKYKYKKVGHAGTLDPNATGVLILGINDGTKLLSKLILDDKEYIATIQFGYSTDTYDLEGKIVNKTNNKVEITDIENFIKHYLKLKNFNQSPPMYSAIKIDGKKLYEYARKEIKIDIPKRNVSLYKCDILEFDYEKQILKLKMLVSKGFYIRSFANDIGIELNSYATLIDLIRTKSGEYKIEDAINIDDC